MNGAKVESYQLIGKKCFYLQAADNKVKLESKYQQLQNEMKEWKCTIQ